MKDVQGSGVFIVNFEHISHLFLKFLLLTFNKSMLASKLVALVLQSNFSETKIFFLLNYT